MEGCPWQGHSSRRIGGGCLCAGHEVAIETGQQVSLEERGAPLLTSHSPAWLIAVDVVPAVLTEGIAYQWRAHDKDDLTLGHARSQLVHHLLGDDVALLDVDLVNARELQSRDAASGKYNEAQQDGQSRERAGSAGLRIGHGVNFHKVRFRGIIPQSFRWAKC